MRQSRMAALLLVLPLAAMPSAALAYVGPGAGLSLLGALWGLLVVVGLALAFVVAWPVKRMLGRRGRNAAVASGGTEAREEPGPARRSVEAPGE